MKDPIRFVRKAILTALTGNISYGGSVVPIYGRVPSNATYPFVRVYSLSSGETNQNRDSFNSEVITRIEVVTRFQSDNGGELQCNAIVSDCLELVRTRSAGYFNLESDGFNVYTSENEGIQYIEQDLSDHTYFRAIIELSNRVQQVSTQRPFIFRIITNQDNQFTLPLTDNGTVDIVVDWGDGSKDTITAFDQAEKTHTYANFLEYEIKITGTLQGFRFNNTGDNSFMRNIKNWGILEINTDAVFRGCGNLVATATDKPKNITSLNNTFNSAFDFNGNLNNWDVSSVTNFAGCFFRAREFNGDITNWDVSSATLFNDMFDDAERFNQNISNWDVSNVNTFKEMFQSADDFNQPIGSWTIKNEGNVNMQRMFRNAISFDQSLANWNMTQVNNLIEFLSNATLSTANYDATLIGWAAQTVRSGLTCDFGNSQYTAGGAAEAARNTLINTYGWTITDGGAA
jgi:surface protein